MEYLGESAVVGGQFGSFEKTPDDEDFLVKGELKTGEKTGVLKNHKLKVEGRENTSEHYGIAHMVLHHLGKEVPFDDDCQVCNPNH